MSNEELSSILNLQPPDINFRLLLIFPLSERVAKEEIEHLLFRGLTHITEQNPILRSWARRSTDGSSKYTVSPPPESQANDDWAINKAQLHSANPSFMSFDGLKERGATPDLLNDSDLAPRPRIPKDAGPHPVFDFKATRIEGGLVLCFLILHKVLDGTSTGTLIHQFAEGSWNISAAGFDPHVRSARYGPRVELNEANHAQFINPKTPPEPYRLLTSPESPNHVAGNAVCKLFCISAPKVSELKRLCSNGQMSFISTNDAVSALIMHALTRARNLDPQNVLQTGAHFPVNIRSKFSAPIPESKLGNYVFCARAPVPTAQALSTRPSALAATAAAIRKAVTDLDSNRIHEILSWVRAQPNNAMSIDWHYSYYGDDETDYGLVSWANMGLYDLDFGFGKPEFVRVPGDVVFSDSCRIMPRLRDGGQEIVMGLTAEEMRALENDELWGAWVETFGTV